MSNHICNTTNQLTFKQYLTAIYPQDKQILLSYDDYELMCLYSSSYTKYLGDTKLKEM